MDHAIPKLTLRRFKTRFSCSFLLQLLASCASERVQHHGAHPWIRGQSKQKRPKAILKSCIFLIKGVVWSRKCIEKPLPKLAAETKRPQQPKRFNSASPKSVANVFKAKKTYRTKRQKTDVGDGWPCQVWLFFFTPQGAPRGKKNAKLDKNANWTLQCKMAS